MENFLDLRPRDPDDDVSGLVDADPAKQLVAHAQRRRQAVEQIPHSDGFIEAMRMAREKNAWTFRFDDYTDIVDDLPIGGYEPGLRMGRSSG